MKPGEFGTSFVSVGSKTYGMVTNHNRTVLKCKGIHQTGIVGELMQPSLFKAVLLSDLAEIDRFYASIPNQELREKILERQGAASTSESSEVIIPDPTLVRRLKKIEITSHSAHMKTISCTYDKRCIMKCPKTGSWTTNAFGYRA